MSTYAIGDLQGCYDELILLLDKLNFNEHQDQLWFVGDLINRGPASLKTLRFIKSLGNSAISVLGNHDLHLLALAHKARPPHRKDTLEEILQADDTESLMTWLKQRPLLVQEVDLKFTMIHAGLPPQWTLEQAKELAEETETMIKSEQFGDFLQHMYGDQPDCWSASLAGDDRYRFIINCFTRMRYCDARGKLNLSEKGAPGTQSASLHPWYRMPARKSAQHKIVFGHWSTVTLGNESNFKQYNVYPLDTGCLWGGELTAMRLADEKIFSVPSKQQTP